jgi:hypothetical protein
MDTAKGVIVQGHLLHFHRDPQGSIADPKDAFEELLG